MITTNKNIMEETVSFFANHFMEEHCFEDFLMLENIPHLITMEENEVLIALPTRKEVKEVVFELNGDSSSRIDGFLDIFLVLLGYSR